MRRLLAGTKKRHHAFQARLNFAVSGVGGQELGNALGLERLQVVLFGFRADDRDEGHTRQMGVGAQGAQPRPDFT